MSKRAIDQKQETRRAPAEGAEITGDSLPSEPRTRVGTSSEPARGRSARLLPHSPGDRATLADSLEQHGPNESRHASCRGLLIAFWVPIKWMVPVEINSCHDRRADRTIATTLTMPQQRRPGAGQTGTRGWHVTVACGAAQNQIPAEPVAFSRTNTAFPMRKDGPASRCVFARPSRKTRTRTQPHVRDRVRSGSPLPLHSLPTVAVTRKLLQSGAGMTIEKCFQTHSSVLL